MVLPDLLFVFYYILIYFLVEFCDVWVVGVYFSELISIIDFGEYVGWYRFISFVYITSGNVHIVSLKDGVCNECCFLMNIVCGGVVSECCVYPGGVFFPVCFIVIDECSSFM